MIVHYVTTLRNPFCKLSVVKVSQGVSRGSRCRGTSGRRDDVSAFLPNLSAKRSNTFDYNRLRLGVLIISEYQHYLTSNHGVTKYHLFSYLSNFWVTEPPKTLVF